MSHHLAGQFEVYRTSAGAGKTFTIVQEYILLILQNRAKFDSIAAITFTNMAANEMKDRIIEYLAALSLLNTDRKDIAELLHYLEKETGKSAKEISTECKSILREILHKYSKFTISTIDSFIHDILRVFSRDLKLPENFSVEMDTAMLVDMIVQEVLNSIGQSTDNSGIQQKITDYIISMALEQFEYKDKWDVSALLAHIAKLLFTEDTSEYISGNAAVSVDEFSSLIERLRSIRKVMKNQVEQSAKAALTEIDNHGLTEKDFYYGTRGIYGYFTKNMNSFDGKNNLEGNSYVIKSISENTWVSSGKKDIPEQLKHILIEKYNEICNDTNRYYSFLEMLQQMLTPMALLAMMHAILQTYQQQNQVIPISAFQTFISAIVRTEPAPFIYERIGQRYRSFLLDEFQDTSVMQWHNFLPLVDNALSENHKVLIVGDVKQSIYRFRKSEMEQMMVLPAIFNLPANIPHFAMMEDNLEANFYDKTTANNFKNMNYRSGSHIVNFNNTYFEWIRKLFAESNNNPLLVNAYDNAAQDVPESSKNKGMVAISLLKEENYRDTTFQTILEIIRQQKNYADVAVLVRGNNNAREIAAFLMNASPSIPVISSESLSLSFSPKVNFIIDMLRLVSDSKNDTALFGAFTFLHIYNMLPQTRQIPFSNHAGKFASIKEYDRFQFFISLLRDNAYEPDFSTIRRLPAHEAISELIRVFHFDNFPDAYILFLQNAVLDWVRKNNGSVSGFLKFWEEKGSDTSIIVPEGADAVRIMTIHKSKGLQFPVVIYPFADQQTKNSKDDRIWVKTDLLPENIRSQVQFPQSMTHVLSKVNAGSELPTGELKDVLDKEKHKQQLDALNIHYVAMTRAKNELHVICKDPITEKKTLSSLKYNNLNEFLAGFVGESGTSEQTDEKKRCFTFGEHQKENPQMAKHKKSGPELTSFPMRHLSSGNLRYRGMSAKLQYTNARDMGNIFHLLMSSISDFQNIIPELSAFLMKMQIPEQAAITLKKMIHQVSMDETLQKIIASSENIFSESNILSQGKAYRPDMILHSEKQTWVLDFKTGEKKQTHVDQVRTYCSLLDKMEFPEVTPYIVYVHEDSCETISVS